MSKPARAFDAARMPLQQAEDSDILHFLTRTLQAHFLDAKPQDVLTKLLNLRDALAQQESTLSDWPDSPSKARICAALAKALQLVVQLIEDFERAKN